MALNINGTTGISGVDGSVSAPALTGTDSNTGITFPAADTIKFSTGGVERMSITNSGITGISPGITMAQSWRLSSSFSVPNSNVFITSNLEAADSYSYGQIGSSMTESSGAFTFPSTGIYLIQFIGVHTSSSQANWSQTEIHYTENNSSYDPTAYGYANLSDGGAYQSSYCQFLFDVTDTSTHKIKFGCRGSVSNTSLLGHTNQNNTTFQFTKLGYT